MRSASGSRFHLSGGPVTPPSLGPLTATPFPTAVPPFVELEVVDTVTTFATITLQRLDPDGVWRPVRGAEPAQLSGGTWAGEDFEAPYGAVLNYRAVREDGTLFYSLTGYPSGPSADLIMHVPDPWLIHPGIPLLSQPLKVRLQDKETRPARRGVFSPLSGGLPIVVSSRRVAASSQLEVLTETLNEQEALLALLDDGQALLLNLPAEQGWGLPTCWVSVGDVDTTRDIQYGASPRRVWSLPYSVVNRPVGDLQSVWSFNALAASEDSFNSVKFDYATMADLAAHRPVGT